MKLSSIALPWKKATNVSGEIEEPKQGKFRTVVQTIFMLAGPLLLLLIYFKTMFVGLTNPEALDYAQVGRNMMMGHGFVTEILRPLALTHGANPLSQPDVIHSPLYPFLLALSFGLLGAKDTAVAIVSGVFFLLTIPLVYQLGLRAFSRTVGILSALIFTCNGQLLEYAVSGGPMTLYIFLLTWMLLLVFSIVRNAEKSPDKISLGRYALVGVAAGLLYLTEPMFFCIVPFVIVAMYMLTQIRKGQAMAALLLPMGLLMLPWMARNMALTGNPVFGMRGAEFWMNTKGHYLNYAAYRLFPADISLGAGILKAILQKIVLSTVEVIRVFPEISVSWLLAFFLPCLLFRYSNGAANALRRTMLLCLLGLFVSAVVFRIQMQLFVAVIPTMLVFSVAYMVHLTQQAQVNRNTLAMMTSLIAIAIGLPVISGMVVADRPVGIKEVSAARALQQSVALDEVVLSDQPWIVAWFSNRPAIWIPLNDAKFGDLRKQFPKTRWLFLTDRAPEMSPQWSSIYNAFSNWNGRYVQASNDNRILDRLTINGTGSDLLEGLTGFTSMPPDKSASLSVVVASVPGGQQQLGMRLPPDKTPDR